MARPVRREWHRGEHREDVDHERLRVEEQSQRGSEARHSPYEVGGQEDPLTRRAIASDRDEWRDERARHHPGEQHQPDGAGAVRGERDDGQGDERRPLGGVEAAPRELRPPKPRIGPKLTQRGEPLGDARDRHATSIAGLSRPVVRAATPRRRQAPRAPPGGTARCTTPRRRRSPPASRSRSPPRPPRRPRARGRRSSRPA